MSDKHVFKFQWASTRYESNRDTTKRLFSTWSQAGAYAAKQEREDKAWRCVGIERED